MRIFLGLLGLLGATAEAQEFVPRASDKVLDHAAMQEQVVGRTHVFFDGGQSFFSVSGTYSYTYSDGGRAYGTYAVRDGAEGIICSEFATGFSRCDMYVNDGNRLVLITEAGDRFPVREAW